VSEAVLDDATLVRVEEVLRAACGLTLARSLRRSLETALGKAAGASGLEPAAFLRLLLVRESTAVESFIEHAVIGETYFFRHPEHLRALARLALTHTGPTFHVWSAGCASGEEPYSIAMALLAAGFSMRQTRRGGVAQMITGGIAAGFALFVVDRVSNEFGEAGSLPVVLAASAGPGGVNAAALTLEAVARRAHVGRSTLRYHFGGRQGLVEALVREHRGHAAALLATLKWKKAEGAGRVRRPRRPTRSRALRAVPAGDARRRSGDRWALP